MGPIQRSPLNIVHPKKDQLESTVEKLVLHFPKNGICGHLAMSRDQQQGFAVFVAKVCQVGQRAIEFVTNSRREKLFPDVEVNEGGLDLSKGIDIEAALRTNQQKQLLKQLEKESVKPESLSDFFLDKKGSFDKVTNYLNLGFTLAKKSLDAGEKLDMLNLEESPEFKKFGENLAMTKAANNELKHWVNLGMKCCQIDQESGKLLLLEGKIKELKEQIETSGKQNGEGATIQLKNELNQLVLQFNEQKAKVDGMQEDLILNTLKSVTKKGADYAESIAKTLALGSEATVMAGSFVTSLTLVGGLVTLAESINTMVSAGSSIEQIRKNQDALTSFLEIPKPKIELQDVLINNMYKMKQDHLKKSEEILKSQAIFAAANLVSASLQTGKFGVALVALISSTVVATPGLNVAAATIATLTATGLKGAELYNKVKYDREGVKLDVQIVEESAQILARSGAFYSEALVFNEVRSELEALRFKEIDVKGAIEACEKQRIMAPRDSDQEELFKTLESGFLDELAPILKKKFELQEKYDILQERLYEMSLDLDRVTSKKQVFQAGRKMENLAQEFSKKIKKDDVVSQHKLFKDVLKDEEVREAFLNFISSEEIPFTSEDLVFESMLAFIRNDKQMPKSLMAMAEE
jgi:hypothetical protein